MSVGQVTCRRDSACLVWVHPSSSWIERLKEKLVHFPVDLSGVFLAYGKKDGLSSGDGIARTTLN